MYVRVHIVGVFLLRFRRAKLISVCDVDKVFPLRHARTAGVLSHKPARCHWL